MLLPESIEAQFWWIEQYSKPAGHTVRFATMPSSTPRGCYLRLVKSGHLDFSLNTTHYQVSGGSVLLVPPHKGSGIRSVRYLQASDSIAICFRLLLFGSIDITPRLSYLGVWHPTPVEFETLSGLMQMLVRIPFPPSPGECMMRDGLTRAIVGSCWNALGVDSLMHGLHPAMPQWLVFVMQEIRHYPGITVTELERLSGYSHSQFHRLFQQHIGIPPIAYLQRYRLDLAKHLLVTTEMSMSAITEHLGFVNASNFTRFFRKACLVTPSEYRQTTSPENSGH